MLTITTSRSCARLVPLVVAPDPEPLENPPPWSHTITAFLAPALGAGVQTFNTRQSSLSGGTSRGACVVGASGSLGPGLMGGCGALGPYFIVSRTPVQAATGLGGMKRLAPPVGA